MKTVIKPVYYCDFCRKRYMTKLACEKHERRCTLNQNRSCGLCGNGYPIELPETMDGFKEMFVVVESPKPEANPYFGDPETIIFPAYCQSFSLGDIFDAVNGCPLCAFTIVRCMGLNFHYFRGKFKIDLKERLNEWWQFENEKAAEREMYDYF